jgi:hypothetical membrane protein
MILTSTTFILFLIAGLGVLGIGIFSKNQLAYYLGVLIIFFNGLMVLQNGFSEQTGQAINESVAGNMTSTAIAYTYTQSSGVWSNGIGLLLIVIAAGLALHFFRAGKEEERKKQESLEVDD